MASLIRRVRNRLSLVISPRQEVEASKKAAFFTQQPSCQIPDLWFLFEFFLGQRTDGFFVEVGAFDGIEASNTWGLAERQWEGVMVEPVEAFFQKCVLNHASHPRVRCRKVAIAAPGTPSIDLFVANTLTTGLAALHGEYSALNWAKDNLTDDVETVKAMTLDTLLHEEHVSPGFDVLVVDVEGLESFVFQGFSVRIWKPKIIIVELVDLHPDLSSTRQADASLSRSLQEADYEICYKDSINTVFVRRDIRQSAFAAVSDN